MTVPQQVNKTGVLLEIIEVRESEMDNFYPLAGSFAVVRCNGRFLIGYNKRREQWELPAGKRDPEETPRECAVRELYEETGQKVSYLRFVGLLKIRTNDGTIKLNPVYEGELDSLAPFLENDEMAEITLWDLVEDIGYVDEIDVQVIRWFVEKRAGDIECQK